MHIVWLAGPKWGADIIAKVNDKKITDVTVHSYYKDMATLLNAADFVVSRAGSSSISEILAVNVPSLLVPFPYATDNHQYYNALELVEDKASLLLEEKDFKCQKLLETIDYVLDNRVLYIDMKKNAEKIGKDSSSEEIYKVIKNIIE